MPLSFVAVRSCWHPLVGRLPLPLQKPCHATNKAFVMPSTPSTRKDKPPAPAREALRAEVSAEMFKAVLHRPPRDFGFQTSLWTLDLLVQQCVRLGWMVQNVSIETMRQTLSRLGINWKGAKHWITSPDLLYQEKNRSRPIADLGFPGAASRHLGHRLSGRGLVVALCVAPRSWLAEHR
jgi:hypothetical protein